MTHISIGNLLREEVDLHSQVGAEVAERMDNGTLVPTVYLRYLRFIAYRDEYVVKRNRAA